jgi:hypothetical protein
MGTSNEVTKPNQTVRIISYMPKTSYINPRQIAQSPPIKIFAAARTEELEAIAMHGKCSAVTSKLNHTILNHAQF